MKQDEETKDSKNKVPSDKISDTEKLKLLKKVSGSLRKFNQSLKDARQLRDLRKSTH